MDLIPLKDSSTNTTFVRPYGGAPLYHVETPSKLLSSGRTTITKMQGGMSVEMGIVELHSFSDDVVTVWGKDVTPHRKDLFSSRSFLASDGREYKWKCSWSSLNLSLVPLLNTETSVALFDYGSSGILSQKRPAKLSVSPEGMHILDEIVTLCIYERQRQERTSTASEAAGVVAGEAGAAAGSAAS